MHDYSMLSDGDSVLAAVSGGVDSLVMACVLQSWQAKAPIEYKLDAVYIDNGYWTSESAEESPTIMIGRQMKRFGIPFTSISGWPVNNKEERSCVSCAKKRRAELFELARDRGYNKVALGHHKDDLVETFFLNVLYSGNISTMLPRQDLFGGKLSLIRLLSYLEKKDILAISRKAGLEPVKNLCPLAADTRREAVRDMLEKMYEQIPGAKGSVFAALGNVRDDYMLKK